MKINIPSVGDVEVLALVAMGTKDHPDGYVVLVDRGGYEPYVTWRIWEGSGTYEGAYVAFWGHYFSDRDRANLDFLDRAYPSEDRRRARERVARRTVTS